MIEALMRQVYELQRRIEDLETREYTNAWTDWTPTVTQSGAVTVTVNEAKYLIVGKVCHIYARLAITGAGTIGNVISIGGLPTAAQTAYAADNTAGSVRVLDSGTTNFVGAVQLFSATEIRFMINTATNYLGADPSFALANNDVIIFAATYRVA